MNDGIAQPDWHNDPKLSETWKFRFAFFEKNGVPSGWTASPEYKAAFKQLSSSERSKINMNLYAFFFGFIYFAFFLKLWRQALIIIAIAIALTILMTIFHLPGSASSGAVGVGIVCAYRANILYYLKRTEGDIGWRI